MYPTVDLGFFRVSSYSVTLVIGIVVGIAIAAREARRHAATLPEPFTTTDMLVIGAVASIVGVVGSRLWSSLLERWPLTGDLDITGPAGLSVIGGIALGGVGAWLAAFARRRDFVRWVDVAAPGVAIGIGIGRLGCFLSGCCYGQPTLGPLALVFMHPDTAARPLGVPLHPTQLYAFGWKVLLGMVLLRVPIGTRGLRATVLAMGYGVGRVFVESLRADYRGELLGVPTTGLAAAAIAVGGAIGLAYVLDRRKKSAGIRVGNSTEST